MAFLKTVHRLARRYIKPKLGESTKPSQHYGLVYGRDIINNFVISYVKSTDCRNPKCLDVGCDDGTQLNLLHTSLTKLNYNVELFGVDINEKALSTDDLKHIKFNRVNIDHSYLPYENDFFEVVMSNQTLEHLKHYLWALNEMLRVLKNNGLLVIGVPNLVAWHNRIMSLFGQQPTCISLTGTHIRGYTISGLKELLKQSGSVDIVGIRGSAFYPFPKKISKILCRFFPSLCVTIFIAVKKTNAYPILEVGRSFFRKEKEDLIYLYGEDIPPMIYEVFTRNDVYFEKLMQFLKIINKKNLSKADWNRLIRSI